MEWGNRKGTFLLYLIGGNFQALGREIALQLRQRQKDTSCEKTNTEFTKAHIGRGSKYISMSYTTV